MTPTVYVLTWLLSPDGPETVSVYADRADAIACLSRDGAPEWLVEYASTGGIVALVTPDPRDGARTVAPEPGTGVEWSEAALARRGGA